MKPLYEQPLYYDVKPLYMHVKYIIFLVSTLRVFILEKNCTKKSFLVYCGLLSAIKQPRMVQLIRSNIQNYSFYVENFSQDLDFLFQHLKVVHFGKNDTRISFLFVINECITMKKWGEYTSGDLKITPKEIQAIISVESDSALWWGERGHCVHCGASQQ